MLQSEVIQLHAKESEYKREICSMIYQSQVEPQCLTMICDKEKEIGVEKRNSKDPDNIKDHRNAAILFDFTVFVFSKHKTYWYFNISTPSK